MRPGPGPRSGAHCAKDARTTQGGQRRAKTNSKAPHSAQATQGAVQLDSAPRVAQSLPTLSPSLPVQQKLKLAVRNPTPTPAWKAGDEPGEEGLQTPSTVPTCGRSPPASPHKRHWPNWPGSRCLGLQGDPGIQGPTEGAHRQGGLQDGPPEPRGGRRSEDTGGVPKGNQTETPRTPQRAREQGEDLEAAVLGGLALL